MVDRDGARDFTGRLSTVFCLCSFAKYHALGRRTGCAGKPHGVRHRLAIAITTGQANAHARSKSLLLKVLRYRFS